MCTVLFIPKQESSIIVSLRDENPSRPSAIIPKCYQQDNIIALYPKDRLAGGTWIGANDFGIIIVLLNGGFTAHTRQPDYIKSRGLIVTELLSIHNPVDKWMELNLTKIEPHTLVIVQEKNLFQLVWDGSNKYCEEKDTKKIQIWSSATLYDNDSTLKRADWFNNWMLQNKADDATSILQFFHQFGDKQNGFIINRSELTKTLSMSYLNKNENEISFHYHDFLTQQISEESLIIKK